MKCLPGDLSIRRDTVDAIYDAGRYAGLGKVELSRCPLIDAIVVRCCYRLYRETERTGIRSRVATATNVLARFFIQTTSPIRLPFPAARLSFIFPPPLPR